MVLCKKWIYAKTFTGAPEAGNFTLETEELPDQLKHGGKYFLPYQLITLHAFDHLTV